MNTPVLLLILFLSGALGGFLSGLIGIGGGVIYVVIFSEYFDKYASVHLPEDISIKMTIANSIFATCFAGISGTWKQYKKDNIYPREALLISLPAAISSTVMTYLISMSDWYSKEIFTIVFILFLLPLVIKNFAYKLEINTDFPFISSQVLLSIGLISGIITALTGLGGGILVILVLNSFFKMSIKKAFSVSLFMIALVSFCLTMFNFIMFDYSIYHVPFSFGAISIFATLPVIIGVIIFAPAGVNVAIKMPPKVLQYIFLIICLIIILRMTLKLF